MFTLLGVKNIGVYVFGTFGTRFAIVVPRFYKTGLTLMQGFTTMELARIKRDCSDFRKSSRWVDVRSDFDITKSTAFRIIGIGRKFVRVMSNGGTVFNVKPEDVKRCW
jgi:hypothetical protein